MHTNRSNEPSDLGNRPVGRNRRRGPFARLLSIVRGDKYMADAYEPAWSAAMERRTGAKVVRPDNGGALAVDVQLAVESKAIDAGHGAPSASPPTER
jgi:hypothetical protein